MKIPTTFLVLFLARAAVGQTDGTPPPNTQAETSRFLSPEEALRTLRVPEGFTATLFAAEPDVRQPIAMAFDGRGRLWVAENYTYAESAVNHDLRYRDRIVVLEDADGDGRAEKRAVFWDQAQRLTSVEVGFGGVWALCPPRLLFIPDRDGDDRPDGEPVTMLEGWDDAASRHNFANGLKWGPDGWLYGRSGILTTSRVGPPESLPDGRTPINCGIWRFHPLSRRFEVVCHGTTNPWGMDWNEHGQLFFINTVIGHLWHVMPGAHYRRMYGEDLNPNVFELIEQTADHLHWDAAKEDWTAQRKEVSAPTSRAGGGHAHSGLMIYLGDNWPGEYRGDVFAINLHGRRVNRDHVERHGATYVGRHRDDLLFSGDEWFRGIDLAYGPDGGVFILDWSDTGECHENDGVHRSSGRIFKVRWDGKQPEKAGPRPRAAALGERGVAGRTAAELVEQHLARNEWHARQARRVLQERAARNEDLHDAHVGLRAVLARPADAVARLRALWSLHASGGMSESDLVALLGDPDDHLRYWAVQLLADAGAPSAATAAQLARLASREASGLVLTSLASVLQRLEPAHRWPIAVEVGRHAELAEDRVLPLVLWYGIEAVVVTHPEEAVRFVNAAGIPRVERFVARRLMAASDVHPGGADLLVELLARCRDATRRRNVLLGMAEAVRGWQKATAPRGWQELAAEIGRVAGADDEERRLVRELAVVFGDGRAVDELRRVAADRSQALATRRQAVRSLVGARADGLTALFRPLLAEQDMAEEAVRGLSARAEPGTVALLLKSFSSLQRPGRIAVVESLAARPDTALRLLDAVEARAVERGDVSPFLLRQMQLLGSRELSERVVRLWPEQRLIAADKLELIEEQRQKLTPERIAAASSLRGRGKFDEVCGKCHKLFGEGGDLGPELTGAQRGNLAYWLENILDPSASVADSFRMSLVALDDGRILSGVVGGGGGRTLALQTPSERLAIDRRAVVEIRLSALSLMPDGLLSGLGEADVLDLMAYLMAPSQVPRASP